MAGADSGIYNGSDSEYSGIGKVWQVPHQRGGNDGATCIQMGLFACGIAAYINL